MPRLDAAPARLAAALAAGLWLAGGADAQAQGSLQARYTISMAAVMIGHVTWSVDIGERLYTTTASGKTGGVLSFLVNGDGGVIARGTVVDGHLRPTDFASHILDEDGDTELRIVFENGFAREQILRGMPPAPDTVPVNAADKFGVADPLSAVLITAAQGSNQLDPVNCDQRLMIFDGRRRYDLALSYKRNDQVRIASGYAGPVLVCGVVLRPIAGYRSGSLLVKYVASRRDMEIWFAPIEGTSTLAPVRVLIPTALGTLRIEAEHFRSASAPSPAQGPPEFAPGR